MVTLAQSCSCIEPSLAFATRPTSTHQRITWPGLYRKLIQFLCIVVWHIYESVGSLARGHMIRVVDDDYILIMLIWLSCMNDFYCPMVGISKHFNLNFTQKVLVTECFISRIWQLWIMTTYWWKTVMHDWFLLHLCRVLNNINVGVYLASI